MCISVLSVGNYLSLTVKTNKTLRHECPACRVEDIKSGMVGVSGSETEGIR